LNAGGSMGWRQPQGMSSYRAVTPSYRATTPSYRAATPSYRDDRSYRAAVEPHQNMGGGWGRGGYNAGSSRSFSGYSGRPEHSGSGSSMFGGGGHSAKGYGGGGHFGGGHAESHGGGHSSGGGGHGHHR